MNKKTMMKKAIIWLSYDLGLDGDYNGMYYFLDKYKSKECGDNIGIFSFQFSKDLPKELMSELRKYVKLRDFDRIYVVSSNENKKVTLAAFLSGKRKIAPWNGYSQPINDINDL